MAVATRSADAVRLDLTSGLAAAVAEKGYAASTIADIVAHARVSKRTFYEHFADKEECLMALYGQASDSLLEVVRSAGRPDQPWRERVHEGVAAYLAALEAQPTVARTLLVEAQAAGPRAYRLRQETQRRFAKGLVALVEEVRPANPELAPLPVELAIAVVGGVNELLLQVADPYSEAPGTPFTSLTDSVARFLAAVLAYR
jgi:AcrR family transcriptional regulator